LHLSLVSSLALAHQRSKARQQLNATLGRRDNNHSSRIAADVSRVASPCDLSVPSWTLQRPSLCGTVAGDKKGAARVDIYDQYLSQLKQAGTDFAMAGRTTYGIMSWTDAPELRTLADLRLRLLNDEDRRSTRILDRREFADLGGDQRVASALVLRELDHEIAAEDLRQRCVPYVGNEPLFARYPQLRNNIRNDRELISRAAVTADHKDGGWVNVRGGWCRLDSYLPDELWRWCIESFPQHPLFVRLDPRFTAADPPALLQKAPLRPPKPDWWDTLDIRNGRFDGGHFILQEPGLGDLERWTASREYHNGARSLELHAKRGNSGNLSLMIEELTCMAIPSSWVVGRCIHLDTDAKPGTNQEDATLNHLDLALNVYAGADGRTRLGQSLSDGRVQDATFRTHLLRVEGARFSAIAEFAWKFFSSSTLVAEWTAAQFGGQSNRR